MTSRVLSGALVAGLVAGFLAALLNLWTLSPLIVRAEGFEMAEVHVHSDGAEHIHASESPAPLDRALGTIATTLVAYAGFGLVLGAGMAAAARHGRRLDARTGLLWGLAGFAAVQLAPAVGLPPELPGMDSAGLAALAFGRGVLWLASGALLILLPHLWGAPQPLGHESAVPPALAAAFATRSLGVAALSWAALGALAGLLSERAPARQPA